MKNENNDKYVLKFSLYNPETKMITKVHREFDLWLDGRETDTVFQKLRVCMAALGYGEKTLDEFFGEL